MNFLFKTLPTYIGYFTVLAAAGLIVLATYWATAEYTPFVLNTETVPVTPVEIKRGSSVVLHFDFCKNIDAIDQVNYYLKGKEVIHILPPYRAIVDKGCHVVDVPVKIPEIAVPGVYHIEYNIAYKVNPIRTFSTTVVSDSFTVLP